MVDPPQSATAHSASLATSNAADTFGECFGRGWLGLQWHSTRQVFHCEGHLYVHEGEASTRPSHDLAHLLVGANGGLPWSPNGPDDLVRMAEFNAVLLENLLCHAHYHVALAWGTPSDVLRNSLRQARWFVDEHYAPFPIPSEEAYRIFCWHLDAPLIANLAAHFFVLREMETSAIGTQPDSVMLAFRRDDLVDVSGNTATFRSVVADLLRSITT